MKELVLAPPVFGFVVGTRAMLGFGVGLLVAKRIPEARRRAIGLICGYASLWAFGLQHAPSAMAGQVDRRACWPWRCHSH